MPANIVTIFKTTNNRDKKSEFIFVWHNFNRDYTTIEIEKNMLKILIVASDETLAYTLELIVKGPEIETFHITRDECIIEKCRLHHFGLVIFADIAPYFTSMNIVEHLRLALEVMPKIYVVANSHSEGTILTLLECGVDQYITLPLNIYRLREKVYGQLRRKEGQC